MDNLKMRPADALEKLSMRATRWIGSISSLLVHTALFIIFFALYFYGINIEKILLVLTTIVSLEAIYLSIFIQMSVNRQSKRLHAVARDVGEIQEDIDEIQEDVDEIQEDIDEIQEDVDEIQEDVEDIQEDEENEEIYQKKDEEVMARIEETMKLLVSEISEFKEQKKQKISKSKKSD